MAVASLAAVPAAAEAAAGKMRKYIIFDFDGTLVNTNDIIMESWQATLRRYLGHELPKRTVEATYGEILVTSMGKLIPGVNVDEAVEYYRAYQDSHQDGDVVYVFDGIKDLLIELRRRGYLIGVGTSRTASSFHDYMRMFDMDDLVDEIVTMNDVTRHKPDPETAEAVLTKLAAHEGKELSDAIRAGIDSVLVGWSHYVDEEDMAAHGFEPTYRINTPAELLDILQEAE